MFALQYETDGERLFVFSPQERAWAAYNEQGQLVDSGIASGGGIYCEDLGRPCLTPEGDFKVTRKGDIACSSKLYGTAMPMCMFFNSRGFAIHGSDNVPDSHNASHGCVRVNLHAAIWLNTQFLSVGSRVLVLPYADEIKMAVEEYNNRSV